MNKKRKGFTLAETLIAVTVLAVIGAISIPIIHKAKPNPDVMMYRKAMYTLQRGIQAYMESEDYEIDIQRAKNKEDRGSSFEYDEESKLGNLYRKELCHGIVKHVNTKGTINCDSLSTAIKPAFVTTDGIKFFAISGKYFLPKKDNDIGLPVRVEFEKVRNANDSIIKQRVKTTGINAYRAPGLVIALKHDGKLTTYKNISRKDSPYEQSLLKDFTKLK